MNDIIKEAKLKALSLLNFTDRTEQQLRQKLKEKSYSDEVVDVAIEYVKSFGYVNDLNYAERYILNKQDSKSKREIFASLSQKGISKETIEIAFESCYEDDGELVAIRRLCEKKHYDVEHATEGEKKRMYNYLMRKGFRNGDVCKVLNV